jgi:hypothetical protein
MEKSQTFVKPGEKTFIAVKRTFNDKKPSPYSQCIDLSGYSSDLYDLITSNRTYRQLDCFKLCRQALYTKECGCNMFNDYLNVNPKAKYCSNLSELACADNLYFIHNVPELINQSIEISSGIFWGGDFELTRNLINEGKIKKDNIRFFLGYTGWETQQLENEMASNSWIIIIILF